MTSTRGQSFIGPVNSCMSRIRVSPQSNSRQPFGWPGMAYLRASGRMKGGSTAGLVNLP